jgi:hypothetical protein
VIDRKPLYEKFSRYGICGVGRFHAALSIRVLFVSKKYEEFHGSFILI